MGISDREPPKALAPKKLNLLKALLRVQLILALLALAWGIVRGIPWWSMIHLDLWLPVGLAIGFVLAVISQWGYARLSRVFESVRSLREDLLRPLAQHLSLRDKLIVSAASGFAEEAMFRGVLASELGVPLSSLAFGLFHLGDRRSISLIVWAFGVGWGLGWLTQATGNLGSVMAVHAASNFTTLMILERLKPRR